MGKRWCSSCCIMREVRTTKFGYICCIPCGKVLAQEISEEEKEIYYTENEYADAAADEDKNASTNTISGNAGIKLPKSDEISVLRERVELIKINKD